MVMAWWSALRRAMARHVLVVDGLLAVALGAGAAVGSADAAADAGPAVSPMDWLGFGLVGVTAAGLVARRRSPVAAFAVSYSATLVYLLLRYPYSPILQLAAVTLYSVAAWRPVRTSAAACLTALAVYLPVGMLGLGTVAAVGDVTVAFVWLVLPWLAGVTVRRLRASYRRSRAELAAAERRQYLYEERLQIAKEVHDVVGHSLTVISMQAAMALHVLDAEGAEGAGADGGAPAEVTAALRAIRSTSRDATEELRATLATFPERPGPETDRRRSAPGLERLPGLAKAVASDQLAVDLRVEGERGRVPVSVDLAGYRIVQESLTNVVRHAAARRVTVRVAYRPDAVEVAVTDDGRGPVARPDGRAPDAAGRGLDGMRERAHALGGQLTAGPRKAGGFAVHAVLPYAKARS